MYFNNNLVIIFTFFDLNCLPYGHQYYNCIEIHLKYLNSIVYVLYEVINYRNIVL